MIGRKEIRWWACRNAAGLWLEDRESGAVYRPRTMAAVVETVDTILAEELGEAVDELPETLIPPVWGR